MLITAAVFKIKTVVVKPMGSYEIFRIGRIQGRTYRRVKKRNDLGRRPVLINDPRTIHFQDTGVFGVIFIANELYLKFHSYIDLGSYHKYRCTDQCS
jgi:hypothetical protein